MRLWIRWVSRYCCKLVHRKIQGAIYGYLSNDLRRLCVINGAQVLLHGGIVVSPLIQEVSILAIDGILLQRIDSNLLREVDCQNVKIALVQNFKLLLQCLFPITEDLRKSVSTLSI